MEVHVMHKPCDHNLYTEIIIFPHIGNTQIMISNEQIIWPHWQSFGFDPAVLLVIHKQYYVTVPMDIAVVTQYCQQLSNQCFIKAYIEGILPKGPYLPCVSMAGRALLAGYPRHVNHYNISKVILLYHKHVLYWQNLWAYMNRSSGYSSTV